MSEQETAAERRARFDKRAAEAHAAAVARGEHDDSCEYLAVRGFYLCGCSKRRREAKGLTKPPELEFVPPICLGCEEDAEVDADGFTCSRCSTSWDFNGRNGDFYDDYGDLAALLVEHRAAVEKADARRGEVPT